jgi:hypothetical protein
MKEGSKFETVPPLVKEMPKAYKTAEEIAEAAFQRIKEDPERRAGSAIAHILYYDAEIAEKNPDERTKKHEELFKQSLPILREKIKNSKLKKKAEKFIVTKEMLRGSKGKENQVPYASRIDG